MMAKAPLWGNPRSEGICTTHDERQDHTMRMCIRRLTRVTKALNNELKNL